MKIPVDLGDGVIRELEDTELDGPHHSVVDNENEYTTAVEYRLNGKVVHRSAHVRLKKGIGIEAVLGNFGG
jgi:hypothetical protein